MSGYVRTVNSVGPDSNGNVTLSVGGISIDDVADYLAQNDYATEGYV